ncbi:MAG: PQQ-dependent sugar dehydrogenase [Pseudomonadota bacterium]
MKRLIAAALTLVAATGAQAQQQHTTGAGTVTVQPMVTGLEEPWALAFVPGGSLLITERDGRLWHMRGSERIALSGVPEVAQLGQGGLLDVVVARDFAQTRAVFLSYSKPARGGAKTALATARLSEDGTALEGVTDIFEMSEASSRGQHFGSRIVEARDGTLFLTIGDRGARGQAQNPQVHNGKIIRVNRDGSIPADNPFVNGGALPQIWSVGHRNPQGAAMDAQGRFWTVAHGARGGDEINQPEAGKNYGWPVISYGVHYSGQKIGEGVERAGMEQPYHYWDPSIAPSGMMIYSGQMFPEWNGDIFVGSLKFDMISRLEVGGQVSEAERLFEGTYGRIRDIREAPDGSIWFLSVGEGAAYRISSG